MKRLAKKIEHEKLVLSSLPELSLRILDHAREHGRVSMGDIIKLTGASRNTLKQQFRQLVEKEHLTKHGGGRSWRWTIDLVFPAVNMPRSIEVFMLLPIIAHSRRPNSGTRRAIYFHRPPVRSLCLVSLDTLVTVQYI